MTGNWYNKAQSGHGVQVEILSNNRAWVCWYTFDLDGFPAWICGINTFQHNQVVLDAFTVEGGRFPPLFDPQLVTEQPWGEITLTFYDCDNALMSWETNAPGFQSGSINLTRLTRIATLECTDPEPSQTGNLETTVTVQDLGDHQYFAYVPGNYDPAVPMPVVIAWHGAGGAGTSLGAAQTARNDWSSIAEAEGFIVIAQISTGAQGGWIPEVAEPVMDALLDDIADQYAINLKRIYLWGFSAGGHVFHEIALRRSTEFAAYAVSAGALAAHAGQSSPFSAARKIPVSIHVGNGDTLLPAAQSDSAVFVNAGWVLNENHWLTQFAGGHTYSVGHLQVIWDRLSPFSIP